MLETIPLCCAQVLNVVCLKQRGALSVRIGILQSKYMVFYHPSPDQSGNWMAVNYDSAVKLLKIRKTEEIFFDNLKNYHKNSCILKNYIKNMKPLC